MNKAIKIGALILALPLWAAAQSAPKIEHAPAPQSTPASGKAMFETYCTPCHGVDGRGDGPAAPAMRNQPADLTKLAAKYNGTFPDMEVAEALRAGPTPSNSLAHGSETMPVWGTVFRSLSSGDKAKAALRIHNLVEYIRTIQQP
jgi:mono/diheme cytochrome c family protein